LSRGLLRVLQKPEHEHHQTPCRLVQTSSRGCPSSLGSMSLVPASTLVVERCEDGVACLRLNRARALNAINMKMLEEIIEAIKSLDSDESVKVIVLSGEGKHFCAGLEFTTFEEVARSLADPSVCPGQARLRLMRNLRFMQARSAICGQRTAPCSRTWGKLSHM
jgi:Enoyl-CoA hydratase/isomerase